MSEADPPLPAEASGRASSRRPAVIAAAGFLWLLACIWVVHQGGITPAPDSTASLIGLAVIVLESLPLLAAWWLGAAGFGFALRQRGVAQVGVGMAVLLLLQYLAGYVVGYAGAISWGLCVVGVALLVVQVVIAQRSKADELADTQRMHWLSPWWLLGIPGVAMLIVAACCPPGTMWQVEAMGYDVTSYHLQIPREWVAAAKMVELEHNVYAYLPGLMESAYASLMTMRGGDPVGSVYLCQLFHASFALLAAAGVASLLKSYVSESSAAVGGALVLLVPWVIVTGSLAYNEMVVVAFAAVGLSLVAGSAHPCGRTGLSIGLLAGAATLAKLTAAFTVALPLGAVLMWRLLKDRPIRQTIAPTVLCVVVGFAALSPYLARNAAWTGNPVFPFAGSVMGYAHWDEARAERWDAAHMLDQPMGERISSIWRQALGNTGYGALGGAPTPKETKNIARFEREGGVPVFWLAALAGVICAGINRKTRWLAAVLAVVLVGQFVWWLSMTHLQSRFLVVTIVPLCVGTGLLVGKLDGRKLSSSITAGGVIAVLVGLPLTLAALITTWSQATQLATFDGQRVTAPLWFLVDGLPAPHGMNTMQDLELNDLPPGSKVMVVGNNQSLFYMQPEIEYASAFDPSPITAKLSGDVTPAQLVQRLRADGITHLWLGYSELDRLHATYGFDDGVTSTRLHRLVQDWTHVGSPTSPTVLMVVPD
ncbi:hypothetical protein [Algisphaera agarilytica]|uniref:Dolichyl-phosphate-mannose-protein mannosyltransferase n=1 Tax=Algisphaera agarilytica TaxID=1385975 RepID=A0A7X0LJE1_9BACT|nr:hypothetical protein [Algisphaera agarilytica]MBB6428506.1 hypothetical protein [Algisphaera agarilytica]